MALESKKIWSLILANLVSYTVWAAPGVPQLIGKQVCTPTERWTLPGVSVADQESFHESIVSESEFAKAYARAEYLAVKSQAAGLKLFSDYWKARILMTVGIPHMTFHAMEKIVAKPIAPGTLGVQFAALECMIKVHSKIRRLSFVPTTIEGMLRIADQVLKITQSPRAREVIAGALFEIFVIEIQKDTASNLAARVQENLKFDAVFYGAASGLAAMLRNDHAAAVIAFERWSKSKRRPEPLERYRDSLHLSLARAYAELRKTHQALEEYKKVRKESNEIVQALIEQAWLHFNRESLQEGIGVTFNILTGFRKSFAPASMMVMAMSLNELCQYPSALKAVGIFRREYKSAYQWLKDWNATRHTQSQRNLYQEAVAQLEGKTDAAKIPHKIISEWIRSPLFIALQQEINTIQDEKLAIRNQFKRIQGFTREDFQEFKPLQASIQSLKTWLVNYYRYLPGLEVSIVKQINEDFVNSNILMTSRMNEAAENTHLVEIEIFNGASEDVVWKNLHPDYKDYVDQVRADSEKAVSGKVWAWGSVLPSDDGAAEVWDDELGTLRAGLANNCKNRDKYTQVKLK